MPDAIDLPWRVLPDGREVYVVPLTYGRARLSITCLGRPALEGFADEW
jgi:hypothetical protein